MRTLLILEKVEAVEHDAEGHFYFNPNGEKVYISKTAITTFMPRGTQNVTAMAAEIAELKQEIRRLKPCDGKPVQKPSS